MTWALSPGGRGAPYPGICDGGGQEGETGGRWSWAGGEARAGEAMAGVEARAGKAIAGGEAGAGEAMARIFLQEVLERNAIVRGWVTCTEAACHR